MADKLTPEQVKAAHEAKAEEIVAKVADVAERGGKPHTHARWRESNPEKHNDGAK